MGVGDRGQGVDAVLENIEAIVDAIADAGLTVGWQGPRVSCPES